VNTYTSLGELLRSCHSLRQDLRNRNRVNLLAVKIITAHYLSTDIGFREYLSDDKLILRVLKVVLRDFKIKLNKRVSRCIFQAREVLTGAGPLRIRPAVVRKYIRKDLEAM
jgi:hypothetical protein